MTVENMILEDDNSIEVELASPWERIGAYVLNQFFTVIALIPLLLGLFPMLSKMNANEKPEIGGLFWLGILVFVVYGAYQIWLMSTQGQSLGKKLLNLRVVKTTGEDAGFVNVVLLREVVYQMGLGVIGVMFGFMGDVGSLLGSVVQLACSVACVVMLFAHSERRTLWDLLADTVVIKLPR